MSGTNEPAADARLATPPHASGPAAAGTRRRGAGRRPGAWFVGRQHMVDSRRIPVRRAAAAAAILVLAACAGATGSVLVADSFRTVRPPIPPTPDLTSVFFDEHPVRVTITERWEKVGVVATAHAVESDATLWRKMHFEDWDAIPPETRERGLAAMAIRYHDVVAGGAARWSNMSALEWDAVPQPVRAMAFIRMARVWSAAYRVGAPYGLAPSLVADTLAAIIMAESWFEHRSAYTNRDGSRDLGLGGCSWYCRTALRRLSRAGLIDFFADDAAFSNPWIAARASAVWLSLMLDESRGDLDAAVAAYHAGIRRSSGAAARAYAADVAEKRRRFVENLDSPPGWRFLAAALLTERTSNDLQGSTTVRDLRADTARD